MKYKLINRATTEAHMCDKVTIDGLDYYVSDVEIPDDNWYISLEGKLLKFTGRKVLGDRLPKGCKKVIATNNPSIDIPKVVDDVEKLAVNSAQTFWFEEPLLVEELKEKNDFINGFIEGYNKSQETHPNSDEDMIEFANWLLYNPEACFNKPKKELLELWKSQQPKALYYEAN